MIAKLNKTLLSFSLLLCSVGAFAQYNHELGVSGGASFYLGDANKSGLFHRTRYSVGALYRYNIDTRWAISLNVRYARVQGDTRDFGYVLPGGVYAEFDRGLVDSNIAAEFNFFDIGESKFYKARYKASPYIRLGVGLTAFNKYDGNSVYSFNMAAAIGGKWKINRRFTLGLEWSITKLFSDALDVTDGSNEILDNPYQTPKVGFFDTDWYSIANLYITVNLFETNKFCR